MNDILLPEDGSTLVRRIDTDRFGPFVFQPGFTAAAVELAFRRVEDAHARFVASPLAQVANRLEQEILVSGVFGTNTIEGSTLSEEETGNALNLDPHQVQAVEQQRALNIKAAYELSQAAAKTPGWSLTTEFILDLHRRITAEIPHEDNRVCRPTRTGTKLPAQAVSRTAEPLAHEPASASALAKRAGTDILLARRAAPGQTA